MPSAAIQNNPTKNFNYIHAIKSDGAWVVTSTITPYVTQDGGPQEQTIDVSPKPKVKIKRSMPASEAVSRKEMEMEIQRLPKLEGKRSAVARSITKPSGYGSICVTYHPDQYFVAVWQLCCQDNEFSGSVVRTTAKDIVNALCELELVD